MFWKTEGKPWSIATRLTAWYAIAIMVLLVSAVGAVHLSVAMDAESSMLASIDRAVVKLHASRDAYLLLAEANNEDSPLRILSPEGRLVHEGKRLRREFPVASFPPPGGRIDATTRDRRPFTLFTRELDGWCYQFGVDRSDEQRFLVLVYRNIALIALPTLAVAVLVGYLLARAGLRPLRRVAREMRAVSADRLDRRVATHTAPRELAQVAGSFNSVMDRLATAVTQLDQFAADVAHELRTPVHNLRTAAELALRADRPEEEYRHVLAGVVEEADGLARLIDRLLLLARLSDPRTGLVREIANLESELSDIRDFFEPAATEAGVELVVRAPARLTHSLDRSMLQRAVSNLVANALAHTPPGGSIELQATALPAGLEVLVSDTGRGIAPEALPHLFDRFYRPVGAADGGLGLGLAIVKRVAELHGGSATITSQVQHGTTVRLTLPTNSPAR